MKTPKQSTRVWLAIVYAGLLFGIARWQFGSWLLPAQPTAFWLYSSLVALVLGVFVQSPFFVTPKEALSSAGFAALALLPAAPQFVTYDRIGLSAWGVSMALVLLVAGVSVVCINTKDSADRDLRRLSNATRLAVERLGGPLVIYSALFFFALVAFHRSEAEQVLVLGATWVGIVVVRPLERLLALREWWIATRRPELEAGYLGDVLAYEFPRLLILRHGGAADVAPGSVLVVPAADGRPTLALSLNYIGQANGAWLRALQLKIPEKLRRRLPRSWVQGGRCMALGVGASDEFLLDDAPEELVRRDDLVAIVAADSDVVTLKCEVFRGDDRLEQGRLLEVMIQGKRVLYQVLNGITREEFLQQKHTRGFVLAEARKIGTWDEKNERFEPVKWVPAPNAPVYLTEVQEAPVSETAIGHFPGTSLPVSVDLAELVTHNAAILGILGVGKTFLALELVERMISQDIKVVCLDLTDQYAQELEPYFENKAQEALFAELEKVGIAGKTNVKKNVEEGGSVNEFREALRSSLKKFLAPDNEAHLMILNPNRFEVWRQDSKPFQDTASMASLTVAEITRLFAELILEVLQGQGMTSDARCCLVLEEAHSLIPEWNAVAADGDKAATIGTARAILQGRKYGFGCLVVTQRTASVTKSILNQCNTVFAMRVYDETGMGFLSNYIGAEYARILSGLPARNTVVFGKASSCADPVLIRVNERSAFLAVARPEAEVPYGTEVSP